MSVIKSFDVGNGDMFYINHNSDNFTIIDCCFNDAREFKLNLEELKRLSKDNEITRFISTHPDYDHIKGLDILDDLIGIPNFYVVQNKAYKDDDSSNSFIRYCKLRDDPEKSFYVYKNCKRKWMNLSSDSNDNYNIGSSGINFLWPEISNEFFKKVLMHVKDGYDLNNLSPIFTYSVKNGVSAIWMGDLESDFIDAIKDEIDWPKVDILFAPHHGRKSGHVCADVLRKMSPQVIVIGNAPSEDLDYYCDYDTIKQNSAGNITFRCYCGQVDVYVSNYNYRYVVDSFIDFELHNNIDGKYIGSFIPRDSE